MGGWEAAASWGDGGELGGGDELGGEARRTRLRRWSRRRAEEARAESGARASRAQSGQVERSLDKVHMPRGILVRLGGRKSKKEGKLVKMHCSGWYPFHNGIRAKPFCGMAK